MSLANLRREYTAGSLDRQQLLEDPVAQFQAWFEQARGSGAGGSRWRRFAIGIYKAFQQLRCVPPVDVNAMAMATVGLDGIPSVRTVLLKGVDERGFVFFTNYESRKGKDLDRNPHAALVFYWPDLERQVCVAGNVSRLPEKESDAYFLRRPRGSRLAAWASAQSSEVPNREELDAAMRKLEAQYRGKDIPLPPFWGGYLLRPERIEFWQGRANRLHDRFEYARQEKGGWVLRRLSP